MRYCAPKFINILIALCVLNGCPESSVDESNTTPNTEIDLSVSLGANEARCGLVTKEEELIGGVSAYGQVNRGYKCYNNKIRFLVQDASRPIGTSSLGGSLIDIDLIRDNTPQSGEDTFKELVPSPGTGEVALETIEVINDGTNNEPAVLRLTGKAVPNTLLPTINFVYEDIDGVVQTDYILHPDVSYIEIRTTVFNNTNDFLGPFIMADFIAMGGGTTVFTPEFGFEEVPMFTDVEFIAGAKGKHVNYAYACNDGPALAPIVVKGITAPSCADDFTVAYEESVTRFMFVGNGTLESVAQPIWNLNQTALSKVDGIVFDANDNPIGNIEVSAFTKPITEPGAKLINQTRTLEDGRFTIHLPEGNTFLIAHDLEHQRSESVQVVAQPQVDESIQLQLQGHAQLEIQTNFFGLDGAPLSPYPAKLSLMPNEGTQIPSNLLGDFIDKGLSNYHLSTDGTFNVTLPPGDYTVYVTRGFVFSRYRKEISLQPNDTVSLTAELTQAIDMNGFVNTEFHQHSLGSVDANVRFETRVLENAAEGIHFAASTDHDNLVDFQPYVEKLGLTDFIRTVVGNEVTYTGGIGHFNVYPWDIDPEDPFRDVGSHIWYMTTATTLFSKFRDLAGDPLIQINHPRSGFSGYFSQLGINPVDGSFAPREEANSPVLPRNIYLDWSNNFEAIEVNGSLGSPSLYTEEGAQALAELALESPDSVPTFADYFALLGSGLNVVATGNSDSHTPNSNIGYPRSFIRVDAESFQDWDADTVREAIRQQRSAVGQGCFVTLNHEDDIPMGETEALTASEAENLFVKIQAPSHVSLSRLEVYINGRIQTLTETDGGNLRIDPQGELYVSLSNTTTNSTTARYVRTIENLPLQKDMVIIALVRGGSGLHPTGGGSPFCYSGPTYIDVNDNGFEPWLENSQLYK